MRLITGISSMSAEIWSKAWYVLQTKPNKENQVFHFLTSYDFDVYYPSIRVKPADPRSSTIRPYFPRYMFLNEDLQKVGLSAIQWVPGLAGFVQFGDIPATVPSAVVHELKQRIEAIEAAYARPNEKFNPGDPVRITHGPLAGHEGIFDMRLSGGQRAQILLDLLGRLVKTHVDANSIEKKPTS